MSFPNGFVWGAAAASYQVEGAWNSDGKGPSVWDMMCRKTGAIWQNCAGDIACDHYHRYPEDVALMKLIGLKAYRLSVSWPRVIPAGAGKVNARGLAFYDKLVDELLAAGVQPFVTLFHWDYPYDLYCRGGWLNADSPQWFADYTQVLARKLGDRVRHWMTLNEPQCFVGLGHRQGVHAPGDKLGLKEVLRIGHHSLLAHGRAVQVLRTACPAAPTIGYAPVGCVKVPASDSPRDLAAARQEMFSIQADSLWNNTWWMDPVFLGKYPVDGLEAYGPAAPTFTDGELKIISTPVDFFGVNIYNGEPIQAGPVKAGQPLRPVAAPKRLGRPLTAFRWDVTPEALYWGPRLFQERYKLPIYITENGMSNIDWVSLDGKVHDPQRIDFTHRYLKELKRTIEDGVDVRGYFHWSILDNFEWAEGFKERFGLVFVDYVTQQRTLKDSAWWYKTVIAANGTNI